MSEPITSPASSRVLRASVWIAIGALIAAALVCVIWVLVGDENGIVGRAFLTVLLLAGFAGIAVAESHLASRRPAWFALASMVVWVLTLLLAAVFIWMPFAGSSYGQGIERFARFLLVVLILQAALLHARLFVKAYERHRTTFTTIVAYVTIGLVAILAFMLVLPLTLEEHVRFLSFYWRVVVALAILAAVGTALLPLVNALSAPKRPRPARPEPAPYGAPALGYAAPAAWPTYADGRTPLPVLPDGTPDWNAYYTGQPTYPHGFLAPSSAAPAPAPQLPPPAPHAAAPQASAPAPQQPAPAPAPGHPAPGQAPGYESFPPPPPLPR
ncbi:hypothetical protein N3K63_11035 [Microbacterium sp. W1N]|uniref:hypothetical protein n=1 Tax=Microbacterium festucae TaxID=2977531 RepID=UPI0021C22176|nr:hypothetical protein [Microbacterium festucae]MCT9820817.1 hypothetical protein [Microbacterium festucae]